MLGYIYDRSHTRVGTDRIQQVADRLNLYGDTIVVNAQRNESPVPAEGFSQVALDLAR